MCCAVLQVAGIVAAHFPDDPAANGMAPGVRAEADICMPAGFQCPPQQQEGSAVWGHVAHPWLLVC